MIPKGYRTIVFNILSMVSILAGALLTYVDRLPFEAQTAAYVGFGATIAVNVVNLILRYVTTTPVGVSE